MREGVGLERVAPGMRRGRSWLAWRTGGWRGEKAFRSNRAFTCPFLPPPFATAYSTTTWPTTYHTFLFTLHLFLHTTHTTRHFFHATLCGGGLATACRTANPHGAGVAQAPLVARTLRETLRDNISAFAPLPAAGGRGKTQKRWAAG